MKKIILAFTIVSIAHSLWASGGGDDKHKLHPVDASDVMFKKELIRAVDLREKQNQPLFAKNREITRFIIEAVKAGELVAFKSDSLDEGGFYTLEEFMSNLEIPGTGLDIAIEDTAFLPKEDDWCCADDLECCGSSSTISAGPEYYFPRDLYQMEITQDVIFDKQRSQWKHQNKAISIYIPADHPDNIRGIQTHLGTFSYKELIELFENDPRVAWVNPQNDSENRSLEDAFEMGLLSSYIIKVSNPEDEFLVDTYGGDLTTGIMASQWTAFELLEFEHNLWEY